MYVYIYMYEVNQSRYTQAFTYCEGVLSWYSVGDILLFLVLSYVLYTYSYRHVASRDEKVVDPGVLDYLAYTYDILSM